MSNEGVIAVERALSVLDCFKPGAEKLSLANFAQRLPLHKTTIFRLLNSLVRAGYVVRDHDGKYSLGARVLYLARVYEKSFNLSDVVMPVLTKLSSQTGESASYYVESENGSRLCLFRSQPHEGLHSQVLTGTVMAPDESSTGRVFKIWSELHDRGDEPLPFFSVGVRDPYNSSWSVPIFDSEDHFSGALTVGGLSERIRTVDSTHFVRVLMEAARDLAERLGASKEIRALVYGL